MRIGIDARELCGRATGVGRYLHGLLADWATAEYMRGHECVLYAHEPPPVALDSRQFVTRIVPGQGDTRWEQIALPRKAALDHLDVFFAPGYTTALQLDVPTVVAIHDLSFFAHPEWFRVREGVRRRWLTYQSARRARVVLTISEFSRRELIDRLGLPADRIAVVPPGIHRPQPRSTCERPGARALYVGSIFNRRHVPDLIRAFGVVARRRPSAQLTMVGDNRSYPRQDLGQVIATEDLVGRARWRAYVSEAELQAIYDESKAFAFLSEYEGLGLTPLEALAHGIPPVLLDTPVARESCQDAALYVPRADRQAVADALDTLLFDDRTRARLLEASPQALARFDRRESARRTADAIGRAI